MGDVDGLTVSTKSISEDLLRIDGEIEELNSYLVDLISNRNNYEAQKNEIKNPTSEQSNLKELQEMYNEQYNRMTSYQFAADSNINYLRCQVLKKSSELADEKIKTMKDASKQNPKNDYALNIKDQELSKENNTIQESELQMSRIINSYNRRLTNIRHSIEECQEAMAQAAESDKIAYLDKNIALIDDEYNSIQKIRDDKLEERKIIVEAEKNLPCDYIYDEFGNMLTFDYHGRLIGICDCYNNSISIIYNDADQLIEVITSDKQSVGFTYNGENRLEKITDVFGRVIRYQYNGSKLEKIIYPENDTRSDYGVPATCFTYDASGNIATIMDQSGYILKLAYTKDTITVSDASVTSVITDGEIISSEKEKAGDINTVIEFVSGYIVNCNCEANLTARIILSGSSLNVMSGSSGVRSIFASISANPPNGSTNSPNLSLFKHNAKAFTVKSRRFWSSCSVPSVTIGLRLSRL